MIKNAKHEKRAKHEDMYGKLSLKTISKRCRRDDSKCIPSTNTRKERLAYAVNSIWKAWSENRLERTLR